MSSMGSSFGSFMIYLPLSSSLKDVLESLKKNSQQLLNKAEREWDDTICVIFYGVVVRDHIQNKTFGRVGFEITVELANNQ